MQTYLSELSSISGHSNGLPNTVAYTGSTLLTAFNKVDSLSWSLIFGASSFCVTKDTSLEFKSKLTDYNEKRLDCRIPSPLTSPAVVQSRSTSGLI